MSLAGIRPRSSTASQSARTIGPPSQSTAASAASVAVDHAAAEDRVRMAPHPAVDRLAPLRPVAGQALELGPAVVGDVVPDMLRRVVVRRRVSRRRAPVHRVAGHALLAPPVRRAIRSTTCR